MNINWNSEIQIFEGSYNLIEDYWGIIHIKFDCTIFPEKGRKIVLHMFKSLKTHISIGLFFEFFSNQIMLNAGCYTAAYCLFIIAKFCRRSLKLFIEKSIMSKRLQYPETSPPCCLKQFQFKNEKVQIKKYSMPEK